MLSQTTKRRFSLLRIFVALLALDILLRIVHAGGGLTTVLTILVVVLGVILAVRLIRHVIRTSIWRLRNRLIVTYLFIGVAPIILILALAALGTYIVVGQVAVYLVSSELERRVNALNDPTRFLSRAKTSERAGMVQQMAPWLRTQMPGFELLVSGRESFRYPPDVQLAPPPSGWKDYTGYVWKDGHYYGWSHISQGENEAMILAPITPSLLTSLVPGIGALNLVEFDDSARPQFKRNKNSGNSKQDNPDVNMTGRPVGIIPPSYNILDFEITWPNPITVARWDKPNSSTTTVLFVTTRPSAVLSAVFGKKLDFAQNTLVAFVVVASLLLIAELVSFVIGVSLTRTITKAVHELYAGTRKIGEGEFAYRIPVKGNDQLAELGHSFNNMSQQLQRLVAVAKEKERMESELEIAREVQSQLFPRSTPALRTLELTGVCHPARMVSGDYYDFLCLPDGNLAFAIGDVAGKGISAALLMASIQSIMRTQLAAGMPIAAAAGNGQTRSHYSTATVVAQLNRQLYANTSPEKYATFFFGLYDEHSRLLTYTNAGHLPPLHLHGNNLQKLAVTGTVVGAFPMVSYEEQTVEVASGDLLVSYTDGITEPENEYGEEFGEERLAEAVLRNRHLEPSEMVSKIMEAVRQWSHAPELPDDMTVVIARGVA